MADQQPPAPTENPPPTVSSLSPWNVACERNMDRLVNRNMQRQIRIRHVPWGKHFTNDSLTLQELIYDAPYLSREESAYVINKNFIEPRYKCFLAPDNNIIPYNEILYKQIVGVANDPTQPSTVPAKRQKTDSAEGSAAATPGESPDKPETARPARPAPTTPQPIQPSQTPEGENIDIDIEPPTMTDMDVEQPRAGSSRQGKSVKDTSASFPGTADPLNTGVGIIGVPRPSFHAFKGGQFLRKTHRFYTYGFDYTIIKSTLANQTRISDYVFLTPLAEVPWNRYFLYMSPSDFAIVPKATRVVSCSVSVHYRNVRQSFETNATTSDRAQLNEAHDIMVLKRGNQIMNAVNVRIKGVDKANYKPTTIEDIGSNMTYEEWVGFFYGLKQSHSKFNELVPYHQYGKQFSPNVYYGIGAAVPTAGDPGMYCLAADVERYDSIQVAGKAVAQMNYAPRCSWIKPPPKSVFTAFPNPNDTALAAGLNYKVPTGGKQFQVGQMEYSADTSVVGIQKEKHATNTVGPYTKNAQITDIMEQSQYVFNMQGADQLPQSQPWLHVGVAPTYVTTIDDIIPGTARKVSDIRPEFEVVCEMYIESEFGTMYPLMESANCNPTDEFVAFTNVTLDYNNSQVMGLYRRK